MGIRILPDELINQIAAGEVIEKPAFVVKELIENSIDAKASEIKVSIKNGGKTEIIVSDNGDGISKNDLSLSITRHATSKLFQNNLNDVKYLGFRGEALPSIASVSYLNLQSKKNKEKDSWGIKVNNNKVSEIFPCSINIGTKVTVSDLFKFLPARLKFLKTNQSENFYIQQVIKRLAIGNVDIAFKVTIDEREIFDLRREKNNKQGLKRRVLNILGSNFIENSIQFTNQKFIDEHVISINGLISLPTLNKANQSSQFLFVNGRPIQDRALSSLIRFAYRDTLPRGRHPFYCIFLTVPNFFVDVNVHPTKMEVRFFDYGLIKNLMITSISNSINREMSKSVNINLESSFFPLTEKSSDEFNHEVSQNSLTNFNLEPFVKNHLKNEKKLDNNLNKNEENYPLGSAIYQFNKNYILSISSTGLIIIDQHAAHERIVMEKMKEGISKNNLEVQLLLIPIIVDLDNSQFEILFKNKDIFENLGFKIEEFGKNSVLIRQIPALFTKENVKDIISDLCDDMNLTGFPIDYQEKISLILANMCCHRSVRSGRALSIDEMNSLLREMESTPNSGQCNHGRPTSIKLSLQKLEKLFLRS